MHSPGSGIPEVRLGLPGVGPCPCLLGRPPDWSLVLGAPAASPLPDGDPLWRRSSPGASVHWGEWGGGGGAVYRAQGRTDGHDRNTSKEKEDIDPEYVKHIRQEAHGGVIGIESLMHGDTPQRSYFADENQTRKDYTNTVNKNTARNVSLTK